ncbi:MAG: chain-length determining protein [Muribaculaceae bacterium]|nr:chain-length determining protein [Muribaculaceae bacterium]
MANTKDNNIADDEIRLRTTQNDIAPYHDDDDDEKEIDLLELAMKLWQNKKKICIWCFIGAVFGLVIAFSIPREYDSGATLAPETGNNSSKMGGSLGAMAAMVGISGAQQMGSDAVNPLLYPDVVSSVPFLYGLFDVQVEDIKAEKRMTVQQYMEDEMSSPWWSAILGAPFKLIGLLRSNDDEGAGGEETRAFRLTKDEMDIVDALSKRITASVDQKTAVISINVQMQDPMVATMLADTVVNRLQEYITDYRTNKARKDLEYAETLNQEAKDNYYKAQQAYADYLDRNNGLILHSASTTRERMQNEATLAFNLYNQTAQQVQMAKAKVQENTPVYAIVSPPTVPIKPSAPRKALILVGFVFLAFVACAAWILYGQPMLKEMKNKKLESNAK